MLDDDGYPTEESLEKIRKWDWQYPQGLMNFVQELWWHGDSLIWNQSDEYQLSTGGWSGNEDIIVALEKNYMWWSMNWDEPQRGGHYRFAIRTIPTS